MDQPHASPDSFGACLISYRKRRHLTQQHLAAALGVGRTPLADGSAAIFSQIERDGPRTGETLASG